MPDKIDSTVNGEPETLKRRMSELSPQRRAVLEKLLRERNGPVKNLAAIVPGIITAVRQAARGGWHRLSIVVAWGTRRARLDRTHRVTGGGRVKT